MNISYRASSLQDFAAQVYEGMGNLTEPGAPSGHSCKDRSMLEMAVHCTGLLLTDLTPDTSHLFRQTLQLGGNAENESVAPRTLTNQTTNSK